MIWFDLVIWSALWQLHQSKLKVKRWSFELLWKIEFQYLHFRVLRYTLLREGCTQRGKCGLLPNLPRTPSVSEWVIVSDFRDSYRIYRACELVYHIHVTYMHHTRHRAALEFWKVICFICFSNGNKDKIAVTRESVSQLFDLPIIWIRILDAFVVKIHKRVLKFKVELLHRKAFDKLVIFHFPPSLDIKPTVEWYKCVSSPTTMVNLGK